MAIPKPTAVRQQINSADTDQVKEIEQMLDAKIIEKGGINVYVSKNDWARKPPSEAVLAALRAKYEAPGMGWKFSTQPDRDGLIIWLK